MANDNFISIDSKRIRREVDRLSKKLGRIAEQELQAAMDQAIVEYAEDTLAEAQQRAPIKDGLLRAAGTTKGPESHGTETWVWVAFNIEYGAIQDLGGEIRPVRARALFIPLREGVRPGEPGLKLGVDFQLVPGPMTSKTFVTIKGNLYLTGLLPGRASRATRIVGNRVFGLLKARNR